MYTGIIQETGKITNIENFDKKTTFTVRTDLSLKKFKLGSSIAINGVCITLTKIQKNTFQFDASEETMNISNFKTLKLDDLVNIEPSLSLNDTLDGHFVQGHVDATGKVKKILKNKEKFTLTIKFPKKISKYLAFKGSISINGVSLTISDLREDNFSFELVPFTLSKTNLGNLKKGDIVNIETDMISRYLERFIQKKEKEANRHAAKRSVHAAPRRL